VSPAQPPNCNPVAEQQLLGAILCENRALEKVRHLKPEQFSHPLHSRIFVACIRLVERGQKATPVTLAPFFQADPDLLDMGGAAYLARLASSAVATIEAANYGRTISDLASRREAVALLAEHLKALEHPDYDVTSDEMIARLMHDLQSVSARQVNVEIQTRREVMLGVVDDMRQTVQGDSTGLRKLDIAMGGAGLIPGRSYGVAARMKIGKTTILGTISFNLNERGIRHLYIAGEMSAKELEQRNMARALKIDALRFLRGGNDAELCAAAANYAVKARADGAHYLTAPGITFDGLKRAFARAVSRYKVRGVIFDYLQLTQGKPKGQSTAEFFDEVSQWIANYCREEGIWSIVACQLNQDDNVRGGESLKFGFDQIYKLRRLSEDSPLGWMEMIASRYTGYMSVGNEAEPALFMEDFGPYFREA
jgi:replicative DNA helicase